MDSVYERGWRLATEQWRVVVALFVGSVSGGGSFMAFSWWWLGRTLDNSLVTRTLLTDLDANIFVDLLRHERGGIAMLLSQGAVLGAGLVIIWVWLNGTAAVAVSTGATLRSSSRVSLQFYPRLLLMATMTIGAQALGAASAVLSARLLTHWTMRWSSEMTSFWIW
ncbi:MAG TPA: hypothetical protein VMT89_10660, partial [Candidatus Acidoferrales bacterium]|nr:hypothetical protein [Candidatus Acidoferrales bacterium]